MTQRAFIIINPFDPHVEQEGKSRWLEYFLKYFELKDDKTWKLEAMSQKKIELPIQIDAHNCGIFIVLYVDIIFGKKEIYNGNVEEVRQLYQLQLLHMSLRVTNDCLICGGDVSNDFSAVGCDNCRRWICKRCWNHYYKKVDLKIDFFCFLCTGEDKKKIEKFKKNSLRE